MSKPYNEKPLKVLHVVKSMDVGGIETMIMNYYRNIDRNKIQFDFLMHQEASSFFDNEIFSLGGRIYRVPSYHPKFYFKYKKALKTFFENSEKYIAIHIHSVFSLRVLKIAKKIGIKKRIMHFHIIPPKAIDLKSMYRKYKKIQVSKYATFKFACGIESGKWLYGNNTYVVMKNAINVDKFIFSNEIRQKTRNNLNIDSKLVIGHVGRFDAQKNHTFLLDVFSEIHKQRSDAVLLLVGDGGLRADIENKIEKLNIKNNVILTGVRSDVPDLLQAMDVFVFPSHFEGFPVCLVEAQAADLTIFASDTIDSSCKIIDKIEFLSLNSSAEDWANKILINIKNGISQRTSRKEEITEAGYDIKKSAEWLQDFYLSNS